MTSAWTSSNSSKTVRGVRAQRPRRGRRARRGPPWPQHRPGSQGSLLLSHPVRRCMARFHQQRSMVAGRACRPSLDRALAPLLPTSQRSMTHCSATPSRIILLVVCCGWEPPARLSGVALVPAPSVPATCLTRASRPQPRSALRLDPTARFPTQDQAAKDHRRCIPSPRAHGRSQQATC